MSKCRPLPPSPKRLAFFSLLCLPNHSLPQNLTPKISPLTFQPRLRVIIHHSKLIIKHRLPRTFPPRRTMRQLANCRIVLHPLLQFLIHHSTFIINHLSPRRTSPPLLLPSGVTSEICSPRVSLRSAQRTPRRIVCRTPPKGTSDRCGGEQLARGG